MPDLDDQEPAGEEAEAQREETAMPLVWGGLGVLVVAGFAAWMIFGGHSPSKPIAPVVAPAESPTSR